MAYALILSAEVQRVFHSNERSPWLDASAKWLIGNLDLDRDGIHGFGLADEWDAFQDGSTNPAHHEYTITTALVVKALLDLHAIDIDTLRRANTLEAVENCLRPYLDAEHDSPLGIPAYSLSSADRNYDVFNPAVFLAGQMQRFGSLPETDRAGLWRKRAQHIIHTVVDHAKHDPQGNIHWNYGVQQPLQRPNDLVHACYMIEGFRAFRDHGGKIPLEWDRITGHLHSFNDDGEWNEYPLIDRKYKGYGPRLWALGILLHTLAMENFDQEQQEEFFGQLKKYHKGAGEFKLKPDDERTLVRHEAHLLFGLATFLYNGSGTATETDRSDPQKGI